ncbi:thiol reductant ABC exporter subunit CydD [Virgibacillus halodenitrificans]|uniref:Thiol reductant ABC exporter subunit CydD n=1 Tax=Virgibacillus halodenitrificans TaxID=1482 RepID=A0AAC9NJK1_VIRHA|nr:thiol reductant ABC exporter subunit CydD [Virgibacillus halodenitrificans]APC46915.1 thiol reductant ABC exporter subunit CydD [Virgibacillus halodenitrificans]MCG1027495.1 thiol reductant ABC exporter subunit CydD [Virgibacillus halodenitrificans]MEC2159250.1 thiol reductant ABC exporter subunit CydD [Virgibacillus halodenitrificans]
MTSLKAYMLTKKKSLTIMLLLSILIGVMIVAQAYLLVTIIDGVFLQKQSFSEVLPLLGGLLFVFFLRTLFSYLSGRTGVKLGAQAKSFFRKALLKKYSRNPLQASLQGQSGQKVSMMMDAVDEMDSYFSSYIPQVIRSAFIPILILVIVFMENVNTGLIMLITSPFIPIFMIIIGLQTKKKSEEQMYKLGEFSGRFLDTLQGLVTLKIFGQAKRQVELIKESSLGFRDATMEILKIAFTSSFMLELISMLSIGIVALEVALQLIIFDGITFYTAFLVLILTPEYYTGLKDLGSAFHNGQTSIGAAKKVMQELQQEEQAVEWGTEDLANHQPPQISIQQAGFSYGDEQFSLHGIQAEIEPRANVAIVGKSGSGKTTLLHLLAGLLPVSEGKIYVNGKELPAYKEEEWFNQLSYISQHPYIFAGTISDNIAIGANKSVTRTEIKQAAEQAGIAEMINMLKDGYDTRIGEGGRGLSGGEMQRVALARAFLKRPSVIFFDEPTTGLDVHTEKVLQTSMEKLSERATVITVAHRLHTIKKADIILYLENGRLKASGKHDNLLQTVPDYRRMVSLQQEGEA